MPWELSKLHLLPVGEGSLATLNVFAGKRRWPYLLVSLFTQVGHLYPPKRWEVFL